MGWRVMRCFKGSALFHRRANFRIFSALGCILALIIFFASGCTNDLLDAIKSDLIVKATMSPQSGVLITGHENITVTFEESMDRDTLELSGTLGDATGEWTSEKILTVKPKTVWQAGNDKILEIECESKGNLSTYTLTYKVFYGVCVSANNGDNSNLGTTTAPKKTIQAGIDTAYSLYTTAAVRVAGGTYQSDYSAPGAVPVANMKEGISIYGGYSENNWEIQNTTDNETIVEDTSSSGGDTSNPNRAVYCDNSITSNTKVDGFTIKLGNGSANAGIFCMGTPIIENNKIEGREQSEANAIRAFGISVSNSSPSILNNSINPGWGDEGGTDRTFGIYLSASSAKIENNNVYGGRGSVETYCIYLSNTSQPEIENNTLTKSSGVSNPYGIYEYSASDDPQTVLNNHFNFGSVGSGGYYYDEGTTRKDTLSQSIVNATTNTLAGWGNTAE